MRQKRCSCCEEVLPESAFKEREDSWGTYSWCEDCRKLLDRNKETAKQKELKQKTRLFYVRN